MSQTPISDAMDRLDREHARRLLLDMDEAVEKQLVGYPANVGGVAGGGAYLPSAQKRVFETGASRDVAEGKLDFEGFLDPAVLQRYAEYMEQNTHMKDGSTRASDNWQKGMPLDVYMKSALRHTFEMWALHRRVPVSRPEEGPGYEPDMEVVLCAILFNVMGYLHEVLKASCDVEPSEDTVPERDWVEDQNAHARERTTPEHEYRERG